jgi:hypothetical protein
MFLKADGSIWRKSHQLRPMTAACRRAKIDPPYQLSCATPHLGKPRHHEWRTPSYSRQEPRAFRHTDGGEALWPSRSVLHRRCHPRRSAAVRMIPTVE